MREIYDAGGTVSTWKGMRLYLPIRRYTYTLRTAGRQAVNNLPTFHSRHRFRVMQSLPRMRDGYNNLTDSLQKIIIMT